MFIRGINGKADLDGDGYVTGVELGLYLQAEVPRYGQQTPQFGKIQQFDLSRGDFIFVLPKASQVAISSPSTTSSPASPLKANDPDVEFWEDVDTNDLMELREYLKAFPNGRYSGLAKRKVEKLENKTTEKWETETLEQMVWCARSRQ